jgi:light-regulated signal transduction histidine kinase (bacteriophytochrome)
MSGEFDFQHDDKYPAFRERCMGTNVNEQTLLATDYLNHFNEVVMTLEMLPDMPELLEEAQMWAPKDYKDHFRDSTIADKELAIEAFDHVPPKFKDPFEQNIEKINQLITTSVERLATDIQTGDMDLVRANAQALSQVIQRLMDMCSANIHGSETTMDQSEIDNIIGSEPSATKTDDGAGSAQADIDALFD